MELGAIPKDNSGDGIAASLSEQIRKLDAGRDMSVGSLVDVLANEAFGVAILIFAAPNLVPNPPGTSPILGL